MSNKSIYDYIESRDWETFREMMKANEAITVICGKYKTIHINEDHLRSFIDNIIRASLKQNFTNIHLSFQK